MAKKRRKRKQKLAPIPIATHGSVRVRGIKRKEIDEEKLALAFILLAQDIGKEKAADKKDLDEPRPTSQTG
ncbi:MAG TPA: hypothetical protein VN778_04565 [Verrucomicrobiae bacterium]|nr:hypothetical protein [Verrucomicrobiae bacterium]